MAVKHYIGLWELVRSNICGDTDTEKPCILSRFDTHGSILYNDAFLLANTKHFNCLEVRVGEGFPPGHVIAADHYVECVRKELIEQSCDSHPLGACYERKIEACLQFIKAVAGPFKGPDAGYSWEYLYLPGKYRTVVLGRQFPAGSLEKPLETQYMIGAFYLIDIVPADVHSPFAGNLYPGICMRVHGIQQHAVHVKDKRVQHG